MSNEIDNDGRALLGEQRHNYTRISDHTLRMDSISHINLLYSLTLGALHTLHLQCVTRGVRQQSFHFGLLQSTSHSCSVLDQYLKIVFAMIS